MVKSMPSLIVGILCLIVAAVIAIVQKRISAATIASTVIAIACIYNAVKA